MVNKYDIIRKQRTGKTWEEIFGKKKAQEMKKKMSEEWKSGKRKAHWTGKRRSKKTIEKIRDAKKGKSYEEMYGIDEAKKQKQIRSDALKGEKSPEWIKDRSFLDYPDEFWELTEAIRKRDNPTCQECKWTEKQSGYTLCVHHIDYNKKNCNVSNLISLCRSCHTKTNFGREDWTSYFQGVIKNV